MNPEAWVAALAELAPPPGQPARTTAPDWDRFARAGQSGQSEAGSIRRRTRQARSVTHRLGSPCRSKSTQVLPL